MRLTGYELFLLLLLFAVITPFLLMAVSQVVQIKYPTKLKETVYESGMDAFGDSRIQFDVKFYLYALLFILFDIETIFLFPWAASFGKLCLDFANIANAAAFPLVEMFLFIGILLIGLIYAWKRDALRWQ